jgi:exonuclease III
VRRRGIRFARMKIATWNVNGIRARQAQLEAWMASERPERNIGWRIDYILASASLAEKARSCQSLREVGTSDHAPLLGTFE